MVISCFVYLFVLICPDAIIVRPAAPLEAFWLNNNISTDINNEKCWDSSGGSIIATCKVCNPRSYAHTLLYLIPYVQFFFCEII